MEDALARLHAEQEKLFKDLVSRDKGLVSRKKALKKVDAFLRNENALIRRVAGKSKEVVRVKREAIASKAVKRLNQEIKLSPKRSKRNRSDTTPWIRKSPTNRRRFPRHYAHLPWPI